MKNIKPVDLRLAAPLGDGYRLWPVADQWSELLPDRIPLRFSIFRYLGFYVTETKGGKTSVLRSKKLPALVVTIRNDDKEVFRERVKSPFRNGVFYVQDICLANVGTHTVTVEPEGKLAPLIAPLELKSHVYEFMELSECDDGVRAGCYQPLREFALGLLERGEQDNLRDDEFREAYIKNAKLSLRNMDARWWLRAFVEHTLDREERQKQLQIAAVANSCRTTHKRKQDHPSRTADKREHANLFDRRRREWKRVRAGDLRMFTNEPLHAGKTVTVYSTKEMYHQLSQYAQI